MNMSRLHFEPVRVGVVGLGTFGRQHAMTLAGLAEADLVALVARRQASLDAVAAQLPGVRGWLDLDRAMEESGAEAWVVAATTSEHVPITSKLLEAGKTVLLEKPIADNLADAASLAPLVRPDSTNLMLGHIVLFNSEFLSLMDEVKLRGSLAYIDCVRHRAAAKMRRDYVESPLEQNMVHDLYMTLALVDRAEPIGFSAQVHRNAAGHVDLALGQLKWSNGLLASYTGSFITPDGLPGGGYDRMEVYGDNWMARLESSPRPFYVWDSQVRTPMRLEIRPDPRQPTGMMAEEHRRFCRVVRGVEPIPVGATYADGLQVQRWMDRLSRCAAEE
jgi:predicted dehydrogenase